jgi:hypothetical protein
MLRGFLLPAGMFYAYALLVALINQEKLISYLCVVGFLTHLVFLLATAHD